VELYRLVGGERSNLYFYCGHFGDLPPPPDRDCVCDYFDCCGVGVGVGVGRMGFEPRFPPSRTHIWHAENPVVAIKSGTLGLLCRRLQCRRLGPAPSFF